MGVETIRILLVEDNPGDARLVREILTEANGNGSNIIFDATHVDRLDRALAIVTTETFTLALLDLSLPDSQGLATLHQVLTAAPELPVVVLSGLGDNKAAIEAVKAGAQDYLVKGYLNEFSLPRALLYAVERKAVDLTLRESEERFRATFEQAAVGMAHVRPDGHFLRVNQRLCDTLGYTRDELLQFTFQDITHPDHLEQDLERVQQALAGEFHTYSVEKRYVCKSGAAIWVHITVSLIRKLSGEPDYFIVVVEDISERRQIEAEIHNRNRELVLLNQVIAASTANQEPEAILEVACRELAQTFGLTQAAAVLLAKDKAMGFVVAEYRGEDQLSVLNETIIIKDNPLAQYLIANKSPLVVTDVQNDSRLASIRDVLQQRGILSLLLLPLIIADETVGSLSLGASRIRSFSAEEVNLAWSVADQVAGALARAQLTQTQHQLSTAIEQTADNIIITNLEGTILYVNPAFERTTGYRRTEIIGQNPRFLKSDQHDAPFYRELWATISSGEVWSGHIINRKKDGSLYTEDATITPVRNQEGNITHYVGVMRDITQELQKEEQYHHAQKMESIGRLAGGIAHDFNNLLTVITGYTELLLCRYEREDDPTHKDLEMIQKASARAASLTRQLLAFSRKQLLQPRVLDLNHTITDVGKMLQRLIGEDIELIIAPVRNLARIKADPGQIEQIIMNLAINARDAMPHGGKLTIETANVYLDETYASQHLEAESGRYVMLAVTDTGVGMDAETQAKIFEPFFTTKSEDKGTGLGLATVYGIVKQSGGHIWVYSEPGRGTTFKVYLPQIEQSFEPAGQGYHSSALPGGSETILVVEDDEMVRKLVCSALEDKGYTLLEACNGQEAVQLCRQHRESIHLLLTDVVMPGGIGGMQLADDLRSLRPEMKVLYMSGYPDNSIIHQGTLEAGIPFLQKPFAPKSVVYKVRELLDA